MIVTVLLFFILAGCSVAPLQTATTEAVLEFADGRKFRYVSGKEHMGIDVEIQELDANSGVIVKVWRLKVAKSGTPEAAFAAMTQQQNALTEQQKAVTELIKSLGGRLIGAAPFP